MELNSGEILNLRCFNDIDKHVASYLVSKSDVESPIFTVLVMLLSNRIFKGDVCLDLSDIQGASLADFFIEDDPDYDKCLNVKFPDKAILEKILKTHPATGNYTSGLPIVLDKKGRLYFNRFLEFELSLADDILERSSSTDAIDIEGINSIFFKYFNKIFEEADMQGIAAFLALRKKIAIISGGPGTGKTFVVVKIIQVLIESALKNEENISIALTAPTGKAALRLKESIDSSVMENPPSESVMAFIPGEALTIHRLLGYRSHGRGFVYNEDNPLPHDVVVVDECSMVDLPLMCRLVKALKPECRIILLGDKDQLASVEGGAVFGDICDRGNEHGYSLALAKEIDSFWGRSDLLPVEKQGSAIRDCLVVLKKSYRFKKGSGIGILADIIKKGDSKSLVSTIRNNDFKDVFFAETGDDDFLNKIIKDEWESYVFSLENKSKPDDLIRGFISSFSILTALREGRWGMKRMNFLVEKILSSLSVIEKTGSYYAGQPLMITRNSYSQRLFNGDIGIVTETGKEVSFQADGGDVREIPLIRIPEHETAFAMTVHKSQGSEFDNVLVVLPLNWNRVLTRELLYTAVTRARKKVIISASENILTGIVKNPVNRSTGLRDRLWQ